MDLTSQVLHDVEFREAKKGYNTQDVDEFLERLAVAVDRQEALLREARQRVSQAEGRIAEAERRAEEAERRGGGGGGGSEADETLKRTLVLAQRTADAAIREAEEQAARMLAAAEDEAQRLVADAHEASAQVYADAEDEARRAQHEARSRVLAELNELEAGRELLRSDVELLEHHIGEQRERLRLTIRDLTALVEDPAALRDVFVPTMADVTIPEAQPAPQPRRLVAAPMPHDEDLEDEPDWATPATEADDFEPVPAPAPRPRPARDDRYADRPLLADARPIPAPEPEMDDDDEDAYLTELRKAMTDDEPLGPRDEPEDHLGDLPSGGRSRFGRRR
jgi:DivIVA domain-containing protein